VPKKYIGKILESILIPGVLCYTLSMKMETPPIGVETLKNEGKFAFEKIGNDGVLHETNMYGAFLDTAPTADNMATVTCSTCKWVGDCNAAGGICGAYDE